MLKKVIGLCLLSIMTLTTSAEIRETNDKTRVIVTSDGEIDDECSLVRFLLYTNEWDVEGIITSSSQYHWPGHKWAGDDWAFPYLDAYEKVYPNLIRHDKDYPSPDYLRERTVLGNVKAEGEMDEVTPGSELIVKVLLDETDSCPVWLQAWGGTNTIARALKTIEEKYPEKMEYVANKLRLFLIWEQDETYQNYIRPHWGKYNILTVISDQFVTYFYHWKKYLPQEQQKYLLGDWMKSHILENHGPLCSMYKAHDNGDFRSEGDSPAYFHVIPAGLRNQEHPDWGGWGGRYVRIRENTWLDPVPVEGYEYPEGRWYGSNGWGRCSLRPGSTSTEEQRKTYFKPMWRWSKAMQNDFASRADWCVSEYEDANHPPVVKLVNELDIQASPGESIKLSAEGTTDPDGNRLSFLWWQYTEADSYEGIVEIQNDRQVQASVVIPKDAESGETIHIICEVTDDGVPALTRYQRVVITVK